MSRADRHHRQRIRDFNLISQKHWKRNRNLIHCSVTGKRWEGQWRRGRGRKCGREVEEEREWRGDKQGKNSLPQLADLGNPAISQQPERRSRWAMSFTSLIPSLSLYPSSSLPFLPPSFSRWVGHSLSFSLPHSFVLSSHSLSFFCIICVFLSPLPHWTHPPFSLPLSSSVSMSVAVWPALKPDYSPQWAHFTSPRLMPATRPESGVRADIQTAPRRLAGPD